LKLKCDDVKLEALKFAFDFNLLSYEKVLRRYKKVQRAAFLGAVGRNE
jgi:hypothetical protein